jgi:hypothetical protein
MSKFEGKIKISRITPEQAEKFLSCDEDQLDTPAHYFTITPSKDPDKAKEGWEDVTYYTNRTRSIDIPKGLVGAQYIYILENNLMPGLVKIGFTKNKPSERVKQINAATGVALDFDVKYQYPCFNAHDLEKEIHIYLEAEGFRVNKKKEFFNITLEQAIAVIERIGEPYKMTDNEIV